MRILILNHNFRERGTFHRAYPFACELARLGQTVTMCCVHPRRRYRTDRTTVALEGGASLTLYETPHWSGRQDPQEGRGALDILWRCGLALAGRFDVVWAFSHKRDTVWPARVARAAGGARFVSDWCDRWGGEEGLFEACRSRPDFQSLPAATQRARLRAFAQEAIQEEAVRRRLADGVTVISRALHERALALGAPPERLVHLGSGAALDRMAPRPKADCRQALGLAGDRVWLGYFANFHSDPELLVHSVGQALDEHPEAGFFYAGAPMTDTVDDRWRRLEQTGRVCHLGWAPPERIPLIAGAADILLLPMGNRRLNVERFPHKLTDYLAAGRPVVASDVGDVGLYVETGRSGRLCPPTVEGLLEGMGDLLGRPDDWDAMGRQARRTAEETMRWPALGRQALDFLERMVALGPRRG